MSAQHDAAGASRRASVQAREAALEDRLRALATDLDDEPSPDFRAATRARLVAMAAVRSPEPSPRRGLGRLAAGPARRRPAWRARLTAGVAGAAMAVTALGTLVALSTDAEPGDALYGLKRGTEQTQLALAGDERGLTLLEFATTRLQELDRLVDDSPGTPPVDLVLDTLATMDAQTTEGAALVFSQAVAGSDAGPLSVISGWAQDQRDGLTGVQAALPADAATRSLGLVGEVGTRATGLQAALDCPSGPAVAGTDDLGPVPAPCAAPATPDPSAPSAPAAPAAPTADPGAPAPDAPAVPSSPAPSAPAPSGAPAAPSPGGGSAGPTGSGGTGPGGGSTPSAGSAPTTSAPTPGGGLPLPVPSLPLPTGGNSTPSTAAPSTPPPLLDTPLPICVWPILC